VIEKYRLPNETEEEIGEGGAKTPGSAKSFKSKVSGMSRLPTEPPESGPGWTGGLGKPHVSECLKLLRKMAHHEAASLMTGATFGVAMFETMNKQMDGRDIQIAVQDLCRDLLDRDENNEPLYYAEGIPALKNVLERWDFDPAVAIKVIFFPKTNPKALESLEILLRRNTDAVQTARDIGFADVLQDTILNIDPQMSFDTVRLAKICLALLGGPADADEEMPVETEGDGIPELPQPVKNWLMAGKILTV
jgi:hypothetical protein